LAVVPRVALSKEEAAAALGISLDLTAAAGHLGLHRGTVRKLAKTGLIPYEQDAPG
jgi:hypothetical protein